MTCIYDDVYYIELLKEMASNEDDTINIKLNNEVYCENAHDVSKLFEYIIRKRMFEKELKKTLKKLNKTNPALEIGKYHILCIEANRYKDFIDYFEYKILTYEWKITRNKHKDYKQYIWDWSWKLMTYFKIKQPEPFANYKNLHDKKND